jgi:hypothetical protein
LFDMCCLQAMKDGLTLGGSLQSVNTS